MSDVDLSFPPVRLALGRLIDAMGVVSSWLGVNLGVCRAAAVLGVLPAPAAAAGVLAADDPPAAGVDVADETRRLGGSLVPVPAGVRDGVLPPGVLPEGVRVGVNFRAEEAAPPLGVSYAPAMRPPATGVSPPLLARPEGVGVFTGASVAAPAAGEPNETADSDRLGGGAEAFPPALSSDDIVSFLFVLQTQMNGFWYQYDRSEAQASPVSNEYTGISAVSRRTKSNQTRQSLCAFGTFE